MLQEGEAAELVLTIANPLDVEVEMEMDPQVCNADASEDAQSRGGPCVKKMAEEQQDQQKKANKPLTFANLTALAQALDSEQAHTSFGKLPMSVEKSQAQFSFP